MAGNIRRNRNNELLAELEAVQRALASQTASVSGTSGPPGPQGDPGPSGEDIFQSGLPGTRPDQAPGILTLLRANSGADTTASATNVDTYAISGLTALDSLLFFLTLSSATAGTSNIRLYHSTDSLDLAACVVNGGINDMTTGQTAPAQIHLRQPQDSGSRIDGAILGGAAVLKNGGMLTGNVGVYASSVNVTTAWTSAWTVALRHGGVTSGGTFAWSWVIYKVSGQ